MSSNLRNLCLSFSGGETSAYMVVRVLDSIAKDYDNVVVVFANTSQENEETLVFADQCDRLLFQPRGYKLVWLEAKPFHGQRIATSFNVVSFETATRDGSVFESVIQKYGIPNSKYKHCNRELKLAPIHDYLKSLGWIAGQYHTAIGIRSDEMDRQSVNAKRYGLIYPLIRPFPTTKAQVNYYWANQPFRLNLKGYQGNCKWCWKKSLRKHFTILAETPEHYEFPAKMERLYGHVGGEFKKNPSLIDEGYRRVFFRGSVSTEELIRKFEARGEDFVPAQDDSIVFDENLDVGAGCEESCEVFSDEDMAMSDWGEADPLDFLFWALVL